jgi:type II secretory pathway component PulJ
MLKQSGFSLTELMVGSTVGLLVIASALQLYALNVRATADTLRVSRLNQELRATLDLLRRDLRRAGYWAGEPGLTRPLDNPFHAPGNDVALGSAPGEVDASCILYSYDANGDRLVGVGPSGAASATASTDNLEQFGFRLRNEQMQMRHGGAVFDCGSGSWQAVSDPDTAITRLEFTLLEDCIGLHDTMQPCAAGEPGLLRRRVRIVIEGHVRSDPDIVQHLDTTVSIANDKLIAAHH